MIFFKQYEGYQTKKGYAVMRNVASSRDVTNVHKFMVGKPEGKMIWKTRRNWENNIEMGVKEGGGFGMLLFGPG